MFVRLRTKHGAWLVHPSLRKRLVADAAATGTNLTEVVVKILSDRYGVAYEPSGPATAPRKDQDVLNVRVSTKLATKIKDVANRSGRRRWLDEVRAALCEHYGLRVPEPVKLTRRRTVAA